MAKCKLCQIDAPEDRHDWVVIDGEWACPNCIEENQRKKKSREEMSSLDKLRSIIKGVIKWL